MIGTRLAEMLIDAGYEVAVLSRSNHPERIRIYSATAITTSYRGSTTTALAANTFQKNIVYRVEIYSNNSPVSQSYSRGGTVYSVASDRTDIYLDGVSIVDEGTSLGLPTGTDIDSFMFYGQNSNQSTAQIVLDDFVYSPTFNAEPVIQTVQSGRGYRLLGAPVQNLTVASLVDLNLVQGVAEQYPTAPDNVYLGYDGSGSPAGYIGATSTANPLTPGRGFFWLLYDQELTVPARQ